MTTYDKRLADYLSKVEAQYEWDQTKRHRPVRFFTKDDDTPPRPDSSKDETRAFALGRGSEFERAAIGKRRELIEKEIEKVRDISPAAAASYRGEIEYWRGMDEAHLREEEMNSVHRALQRWEKQEDARSQERRERASMQLGSRSWDTTPQDVANAKSAQQGGFARHAKRENTLEKARQFTAQQQNQKDRSPGRG